MLKNILLSLTAAVAACVFSSGAHAGLISVNFDASTFPMAATDQPGVVLGANWNNVSTMSGNDIALQDSTGAATTARLTFSSAGVFSGYNAPKTGSAARNTLYRAGIYGSNSTTEVLIDVTNVPYKKYDVYVYASADSTVKATLGINDGIQAFFYVSDGDLNNVATKLLRTKSGDMFTPTAGPAQYQYFPGHTDAKLQLTTAGSLDGLVTNNVFGFQIVEVKGVPEPSTLVTGLIAGLFGGAIAWNRRR